MRMRVHTEARSECVALCEHLCAGSMDVVRISCGMRRRALFLLCAWLAGVTGRAQERDSAAFLFSAERYGVENGLPDRRVLGLAQDDRGFVWAATPLGLARFDGRAFDLLTRTNGLSTDSPEGVMRDGDGLLWVPHTNGALDVLDPRTGQAQPARDHFGAALPPALSEPLRAWAASPNGTIALGVWGGFVLYRNSAEGFRTIDLTVAGYPAPRRGPTPTRNDGHCLLEPVRLDDDGQLVCWCRTTNEFDLVHLRLNGDRAEVLGRYSAVAGAPLRGLDLRSTPGTPGTYVLQRTPDGVQVLLVDREGHATSLGRHAALPSDVKWGSLAMPITERTWLLGTAVRSWSPGTDPLLADTLFDLAARYPEASFMVNDALRDRLGHIWLATDFGLFKLTLQPDRFQRLLHEPQLKQAFGKRIRGLVVQHERVYVNTDMEGYFVLDARTGAVLRSDTARVVRLALVPDGHGGVWRAQARTIVHEDADGRVLRTVNSAGRLVWSLVSAPDGSVFAGSDRGLFRVAQADSVDRIIHAQHSMFDDARIVHLSRAHNGRILACTDAGLFELDANGEVLDRWWTGADRAKDAAHVLPTDDIRHVYVDSAGLHWLATGTRGLLRWDRRTGELREIGPREGLPSASIHAVYPDEAGWLWLPSNGGLVRYRPSTGQVTVITTAHGIASDEFNRIAHAQGDDGRLYFGGLNGITAFDPQDFTSNTDERPAPLVLKRVQLQHGDDAGATDLTDEVTAGNMLIMRPNDRYFTLDLALLSYDPPSQVRYAYRIDGIDNDWNVQADPHLRFVSLPYGEHLLRLRAMDAEGRWTNDELRMHVVVLRPFYLRWWFIAACVLLVAGTVYAFFRYRMQRLREVIRVRDRIARDLHDEVGSRLSSNVLFTTAVRNSNVLAGRADTMLQRIAENSKAALEGMNDIVWSVNSGNDALEDVLHRMRAYAQPLCEAAGIALAFDAPAPLLVQRLGMEERKSLYLVFKEAVANAVRHAHCTRIRVALREERGELLLTVEDDGQGFATADLPKDTLGGNGLGNMQRRAQEVGGAVEVTNGPVGGTVITLRFQLRR